MAYLETRQRREALAADFRARLLCELGAAPGSASRDALVATAVSAYCEVSEISKAFLQNRASPRARPALGVARSELRRCLRALKLISGSDADDDAAPSAPDAAANLRLAAEHVDA